MPQPRLKIPNDWNGQDWACMLIEWPNSPEWLGILQGFITQPARGRFWDERTGSIIQAQAVGFQIDERNVIMSCDEIVTELAAIKTAIESIDVSISNDNSTQVSISNNINLITQALASLISVNQAAAVSQSSSYAWAQAFAEASAPVHIENNVTMEIRPLEPGVTPPPTTEETAQSGIDATLASSSPDELCKRVFWLFYAAWTYIDYLVQLRSGIAQSTLGALGGIATSLTAAAALPTAVAKPYLIPAATLLQAAHIYFQFVEDDLFHAALQNIVDTFENNFDTMVCEVYQAASANTDTLTLQAQSLAYFPPGGLNIPALAVIKVIFNLNSFAALYFTSSLVPSLPDIPAQYSGICDSCSA